MSVHRVVLGVLVGLALQWLPGAVLAQAPPDTAAVRAVVEGFGRALAAGDSARALSLLHPEVVIFEGGHAETLAEYRSAHLASDIEFARSVERETLRDQVVVESETALYLSESTSRGTFRGRPVHSHGTESMLLLRTPDGWRIRHIHWSSRKLAGRGL